MNRDSLFLVLHDEAAPGPRWTTPRPTVSQWRVPGLAGTLHKHWSFLRKNLWPSLRHRQGFPCSSVCLFFPYPSSIIQFTLGCSRTLIHLRESLNEYSHVYLVMWSFGYKTYFCSRSTNRRMTTASCPVKNTGVGSKLRLGVSDRVRRSITEQGKRQHLHFLQKVFFSHLEMHAWILMKLLDGKTEINKELCF